MFVLSVLGLFFIPLEHNEINHDVAILKYEREALNGKKDALFPIFSYYIYSQNDYNKGEEFFKKLVTKGYEDDAINAIKDVANMREFVNNEDKQLLLLQYINENNNFAKLVFSLTNKDEKNRGDE